MIVDVNNSSLVAARCLSQLATAESQ